jgi:membrane protein implicated in regulation of membrane protease activity
VLLVGAILLAVFVLPPVWGIAAVSVAIVIEIAEVGFWIRFLRRYRIRTGSEALIGTRAEVIEGCTPLGRVRLRGEIWHAHCNEGAAVGETVVITGVAGLTLQVEPANGKGPR